MKNAALALSILFLAGTTFAQKNKKPKNESDFPYTFTTGVDHAHTPVKDQCQTGTCWSFATVSFLESEVLRISGTEVNLSEMYNVRMTYPKKAENYVRYHGKAQFGPGSLSHDVINVLRDYGVVPESEYSGLLNGQTEHNHGEMDAMLKGLLDGYVGMRGAKSGAYRSAVDALLDATLGQAPTRFNVDGKSHSPASYRDALQLDASNYISLSSFTHHPFYGQFDLEVPDNFSGGLYYNLPINELFETAWNAIEQGYTIAWDADVSEKGFSFRNGMAILPKPGTEKSKLFKEVVEEQQVSQEKRQRAFDRQVTTDDHLMHLTGTATDQNGTRYFIMKNSWGDGNRFGGDQYVSEAYFRMKTIGIMIHKDALSEAVRGELKL